MDSKNEPATVSGNPLVALIPNEIFDACPFDDLKDLVYKRRGVQILSRIKLNEADRLEREKLKREENLDILLLLESWMPPIKESFLLLKDLRTAIGKSTKIILGLIGRPREDIFFTPIKTDDYKAWENKIKILKDPYLELERLELNAG